MFADRKKMEENLREIDAKDHESGMILVDIKQDNDKLD